MGGQVISRLGLREYRLCFVDPERVDGFFHVDLDAGTITVSDAAPVMSLMEAIECAREHALPPPRSEIPFAEQNPLPDEPAE